MKQQKKKKGRSVQDLLGIKTFTKYGLSTNKGELLFYLVSPTNISVLSHSGRVRYLYGAAVKHLKLFYRGVFIF